MKIEMKGNWLVDGCGVSTVGARRKQNELRTRRSKSRRAKKIYIKKTKTNNNTIQNKADWRACICVFEQPISTGKSTSGSSSPRLRPIRLFFFASSSSFYYYHFVVVVVVFVLLCCCSIMFIARLLLPIHSYINL